MFRFSAFDILEQHLERHPAAVRQLCIDGPYDTGLWRLNARPDKPSDIPDAVFSAFLVVCRLHGFLTLLRCIFASTSIIFMVFDFGVCCAMLKAEFVKFEYCFKINRTGRRQFFLQRFNFGNN